MQLTNADYHAHPAIGSSDVRQFTRSPLHYWHQKHSPNRVPRAETPAMRLGTALHAAVLEPERFAREYGVALDLPRRSNADKEAHAAHEAQYTYMLTAAEHEAVVGMREQLQRHPIAGALLAAIDSTEASIFRTCPKTGLELKCRPDAILPEGQLLDLKTSADISDYKIKWSVRDYGYDIQQSHYIYCTEASDMLFLFVENTPPYAVRVVKLTRTTQADAHKRHALALQRIAEHHERYGTDTPWPAYANGIFSL